jgi:hypothetical protein
MKSSTLPSLRRERKKNAREQRFALETLLNGYLDEVQEPEHRGLGTPDSPLTAWVRHTAGSPRNTSLEAANKNRHPLHFLASHDGRLRALNDSARPDVATRSKPALAKPVEAVCLILSACTSSTAPMPKRGRLQLQRKQCYRCHAFGQGGHLVVVRPKGVHGSSGTWASQRSAASGSSTKSSTGCKFSGRCSGIAVLLRGALGHSARNTGLYRWCRRCPLGPRSLCIMIVVVNPLVPDAEPYGRQGD